MNPPSHALEIAATVVLVRDGPQGPEALMLERPSDRGSFAGAWVFPGGRVDPEDREPQDTDTQDSDTQDTVRQDRDTEDRRAWQPEQAGTEREPVAGDDEERSARRAAVRELHEETGLILPADDTRLISCWTPPLGIPRRFRTWFYLAPAPAGEITLSADEAVDHTWVRPLDALAAHAAGRLELVAPTWVTLHLLTGADSAEVIFTRTATEPETHFHTRHAEKGNVLLWEPDVAYSDESLLAKPGLRHRLEIARRPWVYTRSATGSLSPDSR